MWRVLSQSYLCYQAKTTVWEKHLTSKPLLCTPSLNPKPFWTGGWPHEFAKFYCNRWLVSELICRYDYTRIFQIYKRRSSSCPHPILFGVGAIRHLLPLSSIRSHVTQSIHLFFGKDYVKIIPFSSITPRPKGNHLSPHGNSFIWKYESIILYKNQPYQCPILHIDINFKLFRFDPVCLMDPTFDWFTLWLNRLNPILEFLRKDK